MNRFSLILVCLCSLGLAITPAHAQKSKGLNYNNADLRVFLQDVAMETGLTFIIDPKVNGRVIVPKGAGDDEQSPPLLDLRQEIMKLFHDSMFEGHRDAQATYRRVREKFFWPNMEAHCVRHVQTCDTCQRHKYMPEKPKGLLQPLPAPSAIPFEELTTDFATCLPSSRDTYTGASCDAV